jgi:hypothetical protein
MTENLMKCQDCGYQAQCWDMDYSSKRSCYVCPDCEGEDVIFITNDDEIAEDNSE